MPGDRRRKGNDMNFFYGKVGTSPAVWKITPKAVVWTLLACGTFFVFSSAPSRAGELTVKIVGDAEAVERLGAFRRWDGDGNPVKEVNPNAKIEQPEVDATAEPVGGGRWVFKNLEPGTYDLVLLKKDKTRIEGWHYPPVLEFDPFFGPEAPVTESARTFIEEDIKKSRHYENKVRPIAMGGDEKAVRVLVSLLRDQPTSYKAGYGTLRFEIWQYSQNYGAWTKEKRTRVLHRLILPLDEFRRWSWTWDPKLGQVEVGVTKKTLEYHLPTKRGESILEE